MTEIKHYCDHCGKEIDPMEDYVGINIQMNHVGMETDLCTDCFWELEESIKCFCTSGERKEDA